MTSHHRLIGALGNSVRAVHSSPVITSESPFANNGSWLSQKLYKYLGIGDSNIYALRRATIFHYQACTDKLDYDRFFSHLKLPDTFFSFFSVTQLHVWMCQLRSMEEGPEGRTLRNEITERMWTDIDHRLQILDVFTPKMRRKVLEDLLFHHQGTMISFDEGILTNDKILAGALWRNVFARDPNVDFKILATTVDYTHHQISHLRKIGTRDWCLSGKFDWAPYKPFIP